MSTRSRISWAWCRTSLSRVAWLLALAACSASAASDPQPTQPKRAVSGAAHEAPAPDLDVAPSELGKAELVDRTSLSPSATVRANELSLRMLRELSAQQTNLVVSPLAAMLALHMAWQGARGTTASELASALSLEASQAAALSLELSRLRTGPGTSDVLRMNTGLYTAAEFAVIPEFEKLARINYRASLDTLSFTSDPEVARTHINREIGSLTAGKLRELLAPGQVDANTRAVLTSALALAGPWATGFDAAKTRERPFTRADQTVVKVPLMMREGEFALGMLGDDTTVLEVPYAGERLVMDIVLPSSEQALPPEAFDVDALGRTLERLAPAHVKVLLPRFAAALPSVTLKSFFERLGVRALFTPGQADLSGIAGPAGALHVAEVFHGTSVLVDERGVSPSEKRAKGGADAHAPTITVDRPFVFFVRDRVSDLILCAGRIDDPSRKP